MKIKMNKKENHSLLRLILPLFFSDVVLIALFWLAVPLRINLYVIMMTANVITYVILLFYFIFDILSRKAAKGDSLVFVMLQTFPAAVLFLSKLTDILIYRNCL